MEGVQSGGSAMDAVTWLEEMDSILRSLAWNPGEVTPLLVLALMGNSSIAIE